MSIVQQRKTHMTAASVYRNVDTLLKLNQVLQMLLCLYASCIIDFV